MTVYPVSTAKASLFNISSAIRGKLTIIIFGMAFLLSGCATTTTTQNPYPNQPPIINTPHPDQPLPDTPTQEGPTQSEEPKTPDTANKDGLTPSFMAGENIKRVAILLPFSAKSSRLRAEADSMLRAAELSLFAREKDDVLLIALDSGGTAAGATTATKQAIKQGADIILGPILAGSVKAAGKAAHKSRTPIIGFSTDTSVAGGGVYLLSFPPEAEVKRVTQYAAQSGATKFAYLGPDSTYGRRVLGEYRKQVRNMTAELTAVESYAGKDITVMQAPAAKIAKLYTDMEAQNAGDTTAITQAAYHAILLPEGGTALRSLAPLLPFYDVNPADVQFMGTGLWNREDVTKEPALKGGIFAGPEMEGRNVFKANYDATFGAEPSGLATLAYDAVSIAAYVTDGSRGDIHKRLIDRAGFYGVDGLVRFNQFGTPERGLAIYQVKYGRTIVIDPAPRTTGSAF